MLQMLPPELRLHVCEYLEPGDVWLLRSICRVVSADASVAFSKKVRKIAERAAGQPAPQTGGQAERSALLRAVSSCRWGLLDYDDWEGFAFSHRGVVPPWQTLLRIIGGEKRLEASHVLVLAVVREAVSCSMRDDHDNDKKYNPKLSDILRGCRAPSDAEGVKMLLQTFLDELKAPDDWDMEDGGYDEHGHSGGVLRLNFKFAVVRNSVTILCKAFPECAQIIVSEVFGLAQFSYRQKWQLVGAAERWQVPINKWLAREVATYEQHLCRIYTDAFTRFPDERDRLKQLKKFLFPTGWPDPTTRQISQLAILRRPSIAGHFSRSSRDTSTPTSCQRDLATVSETLARKSGWPSYAGWRVRTSGRGPRRAI
jgi:hypothetical protein